MNLKDARRVKMYEERANWCAEVYLAKLPKGEVVAVFARQRGLAHTDTGSVLLVRSTDGCRTWGPDPVVVFPHEEDWGYNEAAVARLSDGTLIANARRWQFLDPQGRILFRAAGSAEGGIFTSVSRDGGRTWTPPRIVNTGPMRVAGVRVGVQEMPDGSLLMPVFGWQWARSEAERSLYDSERSLLLKSDDRGRSWYYFSTIAHDPFVWMTEPSFLRLPNGVMISLVRSMNPWGPEPAGSHLWFTHSDDGGHSWSKPRNSGLWGYPADLLQLSDGRVLCVYGYRHAPDPGIRACVSRDGMEWRKEDEFVIEADPYLTAQQYHIGYPSAVQLDDGTVFAAYHMFSGDGRQYVTGTLFPV